MNKAEASAFRRIWTITARIAKVSEAECAGVVNIQTLSPTD